MNLEDCKEGVRVYWDGRPETAPDTGTIVPLDGSVWNDCKTGNVWVQWDSDGKVLHIDYKVLDLEQPKEPPQELTEEQAVVFLLSKGYTVSKGK